MKRYNSEHLGLKEPPLAEYSDYFAEGKVHRRLDLPAEIIDFEIALLVLTEYPDLEDQKGLDYMAKFLAHFCSHGNNYYHMSKEGKERIDSFFSSENSFIQKAVSLTECLVKIAPNEESNEPTEDNKELHKELPEVPEHHQDL